VAPHKPKPIRLTRSYLNAHHQCDNKGKWYCNVNKEKCTSSPNPSRSTTLTWPVVCDIDGQLGNWEWWGGSGAVDMRRTSRTIRTLLLAVVLLPHQPQNCSAVLLACTVASSLLHHQDGTYDVLLSDCTAAVDTTHTHTVKNHQAMLLAIAAGVSTLPHHELH
jgi:hypothetical protein